MRKSAGPRILAACFALIFLLSGCNAAAKLPPDVKPMADLKAQGIAPVEIVSASVTAGAGNIASGANPTVKLGIKNISDKTVSLINWTIINVNRDGRLCTIQSEDSGFSELGGIEPGDTFEGSMFSDDSDTSKVVVIIKDLEYEDTVSGFELLMNWTNPNYDAEIAAARQAYE